MGYGRAMPVCRPAGFNHKILVSDETDRFLLTVVFLSAHAKGSGNLLHFPGKMYR